jgi:Mn2+/Fe2+ NRAMP family transporter
MDVMPRLTDRLAGIITGRPREASSRYTQFSIVQVIGVSVILLFFMKSFTAFLYFATSVGLIAAPAIGYYNYIAVTSDEVSSTYVPKRGIILWNWLGVIVMTAFAIAFLYTRIFEL